MGLSAAKGATQIVASPIPGVGGEENAAFAAAGQTPPQVRLRNQSYSQQRVVRQHQPANLARMVPRRPRFKQPLNPQGKKPRSSLNWLICLSMTASSTATRPQCPAVPGSIYLSTGGSIPVSAIAVTSIRPVDRSRYFAGVLELSYRASIRSKLRFLEKHFVNLHLSKKERKDLCFLFDCRNGILHSKPIYSEYTESSPDSDGAQNIPDKIDNLPQPIFTLSGGSSILISHARECHVAAAMFVGRAFPIRKLGKPGSPQRTIKR